VQSRNEELKYTPKIEGVEVHIHIKHMLPSGVVGQDVLWPAPWLQVQNSTSKICVLVGQDVGGGGESHPFLIGGSGESHPFLIGGSGESHPFLIEDKEPCWCRVPLDSPTPQKERELEWGVRRVLFAAEGCGR
jgi:hypothetical protein